MRAIWPTASFLEKLLYHLRSHGLPPEVEMANGYTSAISTFGYDFPSDKDASVFRTGPTQSCGKL